MRKPAPVADRAPDGTAYDLHGPSGAPLVVLIHGLGLCRRLWAQHLYALSQSFRVLSYDLYGHGDSAPLSGKAALATYSDQLAGVLDHIGARRAAVVGFSIGGMINRRFALDYRDRVSGLVILNSPHDRGAKAQAEVERRALLAREQGAASTLDAALERWFTPAFLADQPRLVDQVRHWRMGVDPESYAQAAWVLANGVVELTSVTEETSIKEQTSVTEQTGVPTLVITCENDVGSTPAMSRAIAAGAGGGAALIVPELKHLGLMEAPDAFTAPILEFLSGI